MESVDSRRVHVGPVEARGVRYDTLSVLACATSLVSRELSRKTFYRRGRDAPMFRAKQDLSVPSCTTRLGNVYCCVRPLTETTGAPGVLGSALIDDCPRVKSRRLTDLHVQTQTDGHVDEPRERPCHERVVRLRCEDDLFEVCRRPCLVQADVSARLESRSKVSVRLLTCHVDSTLGRQEGEPCQGIGCVNATSEARELTVNATAGLTNLFGARYRVKLAATPESIGTGAPHANVALSHCRNPPCGGHRNKSCAFAPSVVLFAVGAARSIEVVVALELVGDRVVAVSASPPPLEDVAVVCARADKPDRTSTRTAMLVRIVLCSERVRREREKERDR